MEARQRSLNDWLTKIRTRQILLPRFQRYEAWNSYLAADFLTSIIRDLPVGSTLVLGVGDENLPFISRPIAGAPDEGERVIELLLDGQQRLTALWRALNDDYPYKTFFAYIENPERPEVVAVTRWEKDGKRYPLWADKPVECWQRKYIPLSLLNPSDEISCKEWADRAAENAIDLAREIDHVITPLRMRISSFNLPFLYLPSETPKDVAIEVFIKLNTTLAPLNAFDIIVAQLEAAADEPLHELVDSLNSAVPEIACYSSPSNLVLSVDALFQDRTPNQSGYFGLDLHRFVEDWPMIVKGTKLCTDFLSAEGVLDGQRIPTEPIIAPLIALWAEAPEKADKLGNMRILMKKYMWRAFFTERYDRAVAGAILQDYRVLKKVISGDATEADVPCFDEERYPLPNRERILQGRWPKYKDRLARALLLLTFRGGAEDVKDGSNISRDNIQGRHYHHIFPVAWLKDNVPDADPNLALNCVLINRRTNLEISASNPVKYLLDTCEASDLGQDEIRHRMSTHFIDFDTMLQSDYQEFLRCRAQLCEEAIMSLCSGNSWHPWA